MGLPGAVIQAEFGPQSDKKICEILDEIRAIQTQHTARIVTDQGSGAVDSVLDAQIDQGERLEERDPRARLPFGQGACLFQS